MSNGWRGICYAAALLSFLVAALLSQTNKAKWTATLMAVGLAFIALVPLWDAIDAS